MIRNVSPALKEDMKKDIKTKPFALIVDEFNDISVQKYLCDLVRYFGDKKLDITTELLELVILLETNAEAIFQAIQDKLTERGLNMENCLGFACVEASVVLGSHNSVWKRLRAVSPNFVLIKCICHSLVLCPTRHERTTSQY